MKKSELRTIKRINMKKSELRKMIREEIQILNENGKVVINIKNHVQKLQSIFNSVNDELSLDELGEKNSKFYNIWNSFIKKLKSYIPSIKKIKGENEAKEYSRLIGNFEYEVKYINEVDDALAELQEFGSSNIVIKF